MITEVDEVATPAASARNPPFEHVVRAHGATVLRVARAVVGPVDADDAWSETFLAALRAYPELDPDTNLQAWLVTIAHRKAIDVLRRRSRSPVPVAEVPVPEGSVAGPEAGDLEVWAEVAALPERQRLAIAYHYLGGISYPAVAQLIGGTADAARRAAHDGLASLRRRLTQPGPTAPPSATTARSTR